MRYLFIIILLFLIALLVPPYFFGMKAEEQYYQLTENVSKFENLEIKGKSYDRGWLTSSAKTTYLIKNEDADSLVIEETDEIYHGPIPVGRWLKGDITITPVMAIIETRTQLESKSEEEYSEIVNTLPDVDFMTTLSLNGNGRTEVSIKPLDAQTENGKSYKWSGLDGLISFTPELYNVSSAINSNSLLVEDNSFQLTINGIDIESNLNYPAANYKNPLGNIDINIQEFSSEGKDGEDYNKVILNNIQISGSTVQKGSLLNHSHSMGFENLTVGGNNYGPGIYELQLRNIDKTAYEEIQSALSKNNSLEGSPASDLITTELIKVLPELFKNSPEIEITKLSLKTGEGEINGHAIISVSGDSLDNPDLATNPIFLLAAISADIKLSVSKTLMDNLLKDYKIEEISDEFTKKGEEMPSESELQKMGRERAQSEIREMLDQKVLILKDGKYELEASYALGQVKLNGQPIDINSLLNLTSGT